MLTLRTMKTKTKTKINTMTKKMANTNTTRIVDLRTRRRWLRLMRQRCQGGGRKNPVQLRILTIKRKEREIWILDKF